jgi:hypothetical protein
MNLAAATGATFSVAHITLTAVITAPWPLPALCGGCLAAPRRV